MGRTGKIFICAGLKIGVNRQTSAQYNADACAVLTGSTCTRLVLKKATQFCIHVQCTSRDGYIEEVVR